MGALRSNAKLVIAPIHPGEILKEEFLIPLDLSATSFAKIIGVPANRVTRLTSGMSSVTADTALRLGKALSTSPQLWMNLQIRYDLLLAEQSSEYLDKIEPVVAA